MNIKGTKVKLGDKRLEYFRNKKNIIETWEDLELGEKKNKTKMLGKIEIGIKNWKMNSNFGEDLIQRQKLQKKIREDV